MRYYGIGTEGGTPYVRTVFTDRNEAQTYQRDDCYTDLEMRDHPDLAAALARWEDPTNHDLAVASIKTILGADLKPDVPSVDCWLQDIQDWAAELPPSDPSYEPVMDLIVAWGTFLRRRDELLEGWDSFEHWNGPTAELTVEWELKRKEALDLEAQKVYDDEAQRVYVDVTN